MERPLFKIEDKSLDIDAWNYDPQTQTLYVQWAGPWVVSIYRGVDIKAAAFFRKRIRERTTRELSMVLDSMFGYEIESPRNFKLVNGRMDKGLETRIGLAEASINAWL